MDKLEEILKTPDNSDIGYFVGGELNKSENKKKKAKDFPLAPENKSIPKEESNDYKKKK